MQILEAIIHHIDKKRNEIALPAATRNTRLPIDERLTTIVKDIIQIYGRTVSGYGTFNPDRAVHTFPSLLNGYTSQSEDFIQFTQDVTRLIRSKMARLPLATGGYPLFLRFTN